MQRMRGLDGGRLMAVETLYGVCLPWFKSGYLCEGACITHATVGRPACVVSLL